MDNKILKWLIAAASLLACQLPVHAQLPVFEPQLSAGTSLFNHYGAFGVVPGPGGPRRFIYYNSPAFLIGKDFLNGIYINGQNKPTTLTQLDERIYEPNVYVTFDPTNEHLFAVGGTRNYIVQYDYSEDPNSIFFSGRFVPSVQYGPESDRTFNFQSPCEDKALDPMRSMHFVAARDANNNVIMPVTYNMVYVTCKVRKEYPSAPYLNNTLFVIGYGLQYSVGQDGRTKLKLTELPAGELPAGPSITNGTLNNNFGTFGKVVANLQQANPKVIAFGPYGKYLYVVTQDNNLHQFTFSAQGELTKAGNALIFPDIFQPIDQQYAPISMAFNASGRNAYIVAQKMRSGAVVGSTILVYRVPDQASGVLQFVSATDIPSEQGMIPHASQIAFNPTDNNAYILDSKYNLIYQFSISQDGNGSLTPLPVGAFHTDLPTQSLVFDPLSANAYAVQFKFDLNKKPAIYNFVLEQIRVNSDGSLFSNSMLLAALEGSLAGLGASMMDSSASSGTQPSFTIPTTTSPAPSQPDGFFAQKTAATSVTSKSTTQNSSTSSGGIFQFPWRH